MDLSNVSILNLMPPNLSADPNIKMIAVAFDETLQNTIQKIPGINIIPNLVLNKIVEEMLLDLLAWQFHVDFYDPGLPFEIKRGLVLKSLDWHTRKGTPSTVEEIVTDIFSEAKIEEWFEYGGFPYRFRITVGDYLPDEATTKKIVKAINTTKNTRSCLDLVTSMISLKDEIFISESLRLVVHRNDNEYIGNPLKFNGAVKFDGVTRNEKVSVRGKFDGSRKFNGAIAFDGTAKIDNPYILKPPFKFSSGIMDVLDITLKKGNLVDTQRARLCFDGSVKFNGGSKFNGISQYAVNDSLIRMGSELFNLTDTANPIMEDLETAAVVNIEEDTQKRVKFDGSTKFDGRNQFTTDYADQIEIAVPGNILSDAVEVNENVFIGMRKHHFFNGAYKFDGAIKFDGMALIPMG